MRSGSRTAWMASAVALALACGGGNEEPPLAGPPADVAAIPARTVPVQRRDLVDSIPGTGTIAAHKTTDVGPRVDGIIEEIFVQVGDRVEAGTPLFRTRQVDYDMRVSEARQQLRLAAAEERKAASDLKRLQQLHRSKVISEEQIEAAQVAHEIVSARLGQAQTALERALQDLTDTEVTAPYSGTITQRFVDEGVMMRTMLSSGASVIQIMKIDIVSAIVRIPAVHLRRIRVGTTARVDVDGLDEVFDTHVAILNDRIDSASRTIEVRLPIRNEDMRLKPGLFVKAELLPEARNARVLERSALMGRAPDLFVFVQEQSRAARRPISVRDFDAEYVEILDGLDIGELVVVSRNGTPLREGALLTLEASDVAL